MPEVHTAELPNDAEGEPVEVAEPAAEAADNCLPPPMLEECWRSRSVEEKLVVALDNLEALFRLSPSWSVHEDNAPPADSSDIKVGSLWLLDIEDVTSGRKPIGSRDSEYWGLVLENHLGGTLEIQDIEQFEAPQDGVPLGHVTGPGPI